jgi:hypothetical protein
VQRVTRTTGVRALRKKRIKIKGVANKAKEKRFRSMASGTTLQMQKRRKGINKTR